MELDTFLLYSEVTTREDQLNKRLEMGVRGLQLSAYVE